jgi:hypothetical protein
MTTPAPLARVVQTCIAAPSQWDAWDTAGRRYYLRYRHGRGRVEAGDGSQRGAPVLIYWDDRGGSFLTLGDFMAKADLTLAEGADVRTLDDDPHDQVPPAGAPVPLLQGTFALFRTPAGGAVLAYRAKGSSEDKQLMIPPFILQMAGSASGLSPEAILGRLQSGDLDG